MAKACCSGTAGGAILRECPNCLGSRSETERDSGQFARLLLAEDAQLTAAVLAAGHAHPPLRDKQLTQHPEAVLEDLLAVVA